jgi:hypothetical protein
MAVAVADQAKAHMLHQAKADSVAAVTEAVANLVMVLDTTMPHTEFLELEVVVEQAVRTVLVSSMAAKADADVS